MRRLRHLSGQHRTAATNRLLGGLLAFSAGAINAGGFLPFAVPLTVLMLAFIMGLQNAPVSKMSASQIRTTHMTGVITDIGIELGKMLYWNHSARAPESRVRANRIKLRLYGTLLALSLPPLWADFLRLRQIKLARQSP